MLGTFGKAWNFKSGIGTSTAYFPASGFRHYIGGTLMAVGEHGWYWSAHPYDDNYGYHLYFDAANVKPHLGNARSYGLGVRPVADFNPIQGATTQPVTPGGVIEW